MLDSILHGTLVSSLIGMLTNDLFLILSSLLLSLLLSRRRTMRHSGCSSRGCRGPHASASPHARAHAPLSCW